MVRIMFSRKHTGVLAPFFRGIELYKPGNNVRCENNRILTALTSKDCGPETRTIAIAALPGEVDRAKIVESSLLRALILRLPTFLDSSDFLDKQVMT